MYLFILDVLNVRNFRYCYVHFRIGSHALGYCDTLCHTIKGKLQKEQDIEVLRNCASIDKT